MTTKTEFVEMWDKSKYKERKITLEIVLRSTEYHIDEMKAALWYKGEKVILWYNGKFVDEISFDMIKRIE